jgi:CubicO group peptidase (beta-lactamase class C family)
MMLPKSEALHTFQHLPKVAELRSRYLYNNHAYNIPGLIIERLSKQSYGTFLKKNIFDPLGMMRTFTANPQNSNVAAPYNILSDGTPFRIPFSEASSDTLMFSAVSVRTSMADILRLYGGILEELNVLGPGANSDLVVIPDAQGGEANDAESKALDCTQFPTKQLNVICAPQIVRNTDTIFEQTSALGWMRTQLPGKLDFGWNASNVSSMPLFGKSYPAKLALWHGGNMPDTTSAVILLPETRSAVGVFQNSLVYVTLQT